MIVWVSSVYENEYRGSIHGIVNTQTESKLPGFKSQFYHLIATDLGQII